MLVYKLQIINLYSSYLTVNTGRKIQDYADILSIYSTLKIESFYNFTLPNWTGEIFPDQMKKPACYRYSTVTIFLLKCRPYSKNTSYFIYIEFLVFQLPLQPQQWHG